jgi:CBS domain-containing protein
MFNRQSSAGDICTRIVSIAFPTLAVDEAARVLQEQNVGCLVVVEEDSPDERRVVGMLTDRDIAVGVVAAQRRHPPARGRPDEPQRGDRARRRLGPGHPGRDAPARGAPRAVVGARDRLIGIVSIDDVLELVAEEMQALAKAIGASQRHDPS